MCTTQLGAGVEPIWGRGIWGVCACLNVPFHGWMAGWLDVWGGDGQDEGLGQCWCCIVPSAGFTNVRRRPSPSLPCHTADEQETLPAVPLTSLDAYDTNDFAALTR